jgi:hypothetical protein
MLGFPLGILASGGASAPPRFLVVGGGGGAAGGATAQRGGGAGGAGGFRTGEFTLLTGTNFTVTVGAGGVGETHLLLQQMRQVVPTQYSPQLLQLEEVGLAVSKKTHLHLTV